MLISAHSFCHALYTARTRISMHTDRLIDARLAAFLLGYKETPDKDKEDWRLGRKSFYAAYAVGTIPMPRQLGVKKVLWLMSDIERFQRGEPAATINAEIVEARRRYGVDGKSRF